VWNPVNGHIETIVNEMPIENGKVFSQQRASMLSINGNTELVLFGGWCTNYINEIWKYKYESNSWEFLGNMQVFRANHLVIQVTGLECP
jgi:hypothetical protein